MECPRCRLINPETTQRCDCGYDFTTKTLEEPYDRSQEADASESVHGWLKLKVASLILLLLVVGTGLWWGPFDSVEDLVRKGRYDRIQVLVVLRGEVSGRQHETWSVSPEGELPAILQRRSARPSYVN